MQCLSCLSIQIKKIKDIVGLESDRQLLATNFPSEIPVEWCLVRSRAPGYNLRSLSFGTVKRLIYEYYYWIEICLHEIVVAHFIV